MYPAEKQNEMAERQQGGAGELTSKGTSEKLHQILQVRLVGFYKARKKGSGS